jgi:inosine-uridine nucleoside N-ribohydrolase
MGRPVTITLLVAVVFSTLIAVTLASNRCGFVPPVVSQLNRAPNAKNIIFFTDGSNFDDSVCLNILMKSPNAKLLAIYTQGNAWANPGATFYNWYNNMFMYGRTDIPIFAGSYYALHDETTPIGTNSPPPIQQYRAAIPAGPGGWMYPDTQFGQRPYLPQSTRVYDPEVDADNDAASINALVALINALPAGQKVTFLSTGSFTPIAKMFQSAYNVPASFWNRVESVYFMGGAVNTSGNLFQGPNNAAAEFNIYCDPEAAQYAFTNLSALNIPITMIGLDATNNVPFQQILFTTLYNTPATPEAQLVGRMIHTLRATWYDPAGFFTEAYLWDPTSAITMLYPNVITTGGVKLQKIKVIIDQGVDGALQGATRVCTAAEAAVRGACANINVVYGLDGNAVTNTLINLLQSTTNSAYLSLYCPSSNNQNGQGQNNNNQ